MGDTYKIHYFDARGLAEPTRMILTYGQAKWEDARFALSFPPAIPAEIKALGPYGQVPLLEYNGQIISQSMTIARFVARKFNLVGSSELEAARCDEIVDAVMDLAKLFAAMYQATDEEKKVEIRAKATEDSARFRTKFNEILQGNNGHLVGTGLTWADIVVAAIIDNMQRTHGVKLVDGLPALEGLIKTVFNTPRIKEWVEKRPNTAF